MPTLEFFSVILEVEKILRKRAEVLEDAFDVMDELHDELAEAVERGDATAIKDIHRAYCALSAKILRLKETDLGSEKPRSASTVEDPLWSRDNATKAPVLQ